MDYLKLGSAIRKRRLELTLSQEKLSELINLSTAYIGQIERAERKPSVETLVSIAEALGITVDYLLNDCITINNDHYIKQIENMFIGRSDRSKQAAVDILKTLFIHIEP